jgi:hypothetical protein
MIPLLTYRFNLMVTLLAEAKAELQKIAALRLVKGGFYRK